MPKITKTARSSTAAKTLTEQFLNMAKALASAMGTTYTAVGDDNNAFYIQADTIGYPGWWLHMTMVNTTIDISLLTGSGSPDYNDPNRLKYQMQGLNNPFADYNPVTCTVIGDDSKDTVGISVHSGITEDGSDIISSGKTFTFKAFFAKDVNNTVLCGLGIGHIIGIRTIDAKTEVTSADTTSDTDCGLSSCLHLTKMVNYLSPGYPEMKNAYVSLVRPGSSPNAIEHNKAFYAAGARWAMPGFYPERFGSSAQKRLFEPFEPFIKY